MNSLISAAAFLLCFLQILFVPLGHSSRVVSPMDVDLISQVCLNTESPTVCEDSLRQRFNGFQKFQDAEFMAKIITGQVLPNKVAIVLDIINKEYNRTRSSNLLTCAENFRNILQLHLKSAGGALRGARGTSDTKTALENLSSVSNLANQCQAAIGGLRDSPVLPKCYEVSIVATADAYIIKTLAVLQ